ncbi:MAG TPA: hypothetical protein VHX60_17670 [Acidobacteriaceae bacterium]|jgi:hypothetical protein|nr:hypothetical protein [Acidobacteriaceae bacterium]
MNSADLKNELILKVVICLAMIVILVGCGGNASMTGGTHTPPATPSVYVIQEPATYFGSESGTILQFPQTASGAVSPSASIAGPTGTLFEYLAADGAGNVYTSTRTQTSIGGILAYAAGATGSATPVRNIPFNATTEINAIQGISVNSAGAILVSTDFGGVGTFSATANGSVAPQSFILGAVQPGGGLSNLYSANNGVWDSAGNVYVENEFTTVDKGVVVFAPGATGNVAPTRVLNQFNNGMVFDSAGNLYMTDGNEIEVFAPGATGNDAPTRTISGALTGIGVLGGIALDASGNIYVVSTTGTGTDPTVLKFAAGASGNVAPMSSFTSAAWTRPDYGYSIAVH